MYFSMRGRGLAFRLVCSLARSRPSSTLHIPATAPPKFDYDICVIGAGAAGFAAVSRSAEYFGRCGPAFDATRHGTLGDICLVNKNRVGGATLHDGALSSKTLWEMSQDFKIARSYRRGYLARELELSWTRIKAVVETAQSIKEEQWRHQIKTLNADLIEGEASFVDPHTIKVKENDGSHRQITAANFVIATGSSPRQYPNSSVAPVDGEVVHDSDTIMKLPRIPASMVVIGAGVIGCEYTTMFSNYQHTRLFVVDRAARPLPFEDSDVASLIARRLVNHGVTFHSGAELVSLERISTPEGPRVKYVLNLTQKDGTKTVFENVVEAALLCIGRRPNLDSLNLSAAGVEIDPKSQGLLGEHGQTTVPHIWGAGDVTADVSLANVAELEGRYVIDKIFGKTIPPPTYDNLSTIMFFDPLVSAVGLGEQALQRKKIEYKVAAYHYSLVSSALAKGKPTGFVKVMVTPDEKMTLLGVRAVGLHAATIIGLVSFLIQQGQSIKALTSLLIGYPDVIEGLQECSRLLTGESIHKPVSFPQQTRLARISYAPDGTPCVQNLATSTPCNVIEEPKMWSRLQTGEAGIGDFDKKLINTHLAELGARKL